MAVDAWDALLNPASTSQEQLKAIDEARAGIRSLLSDNKGGPPYDWLCTQDSLRSNAASIVLTFLAVSVGRMQYLKGWRLLELKTAKSAEQQLTTTLQVVGKALLLLQGLLLLHRKSAELFERQSSVQILLAILLAIQQSRHQEAIIPINTPPATGTVEGDSTACLLIDTLLSTLADRPANIRAFEQANGLAAIAAFLRSKTTIKPEKVKCIEFLYFYLQPEDGSPSPSLSRSSSTQKLPAPLLPSTPRRQPASSGLQHILEQAEEQWVPKTPRRNRTGMTKSPSSDEMPPPDPFRAGLLRSSTAKRLELMARIPASPRSARSRTFVEPMPSSPSSGLSDKRVRRPPALPLGDATNHHPFDSPVNGTPEVSPRKEHRRTPSQKALTPTTPASLSRSTSAESPLTESPRFRRDPPSSSRIHTRRVSQDTSNQSAQSSASSLRFSLIDGSSVVDMPADIATGGLRSVAQKRQILGAYLGGVEELVERLQTRLTLAS